MRLHCYSCDKEGHTHEDLADCYEKRHEVLEVTDVQNHKQSKQEKKKTIKTVKGRIGDNFVESILLDDVPMFLCNVGGRITTVEKIEYLGDTYVPLNANECGYYPYKFTSSYLKLLIDNPPTKDNLLERCKKYIDKFIDVDERDKHLILGDLFLSYCQEHVSTIHFPFFVGETESGKSSALHLFRFLGYRCLYGEDIPNADIYNFLGTDEEATGTICEDEAQEIAVDREKIRTYKNSYSKGAVKPRIVGVDSDRKRQVYYKTFCLKLFAGERIPEDKGFKERLAIVHMREGSPEGNIKRVSAEDKEDMNYLRNSLLVWKIMNVERGIEPIDSGLKQRDQELWEDFLAVLNGTKYYDEAKNVVKYYVQQRHQSIWNSLEAKLFKLVVPNLSEDMSIGMEKFWEVLVSRNDELEGEVNHGTFYPNDFQKKVTRNYLAKLFEEKFSAKKQVIVEKKEDKTHQQTVYVFDQKIIQTLSKKYNVSLSFSFFSSGHGSQGGTDKVDH